MCKGPYVSDANPIPFGCGQCLPCRINRRRVWTHRLMLESMCHAENSFVTLTYDPEHLPKGGTLVPVHLRYFMDTLRKAVKPCKLRYYAVGEYGDQSWRPHYHLALFGVGSMDTEKIAKAWGKGNVLVGQLTTQSAGYICGYVTKKLSNPNDETTAKTLSGRHPEFSRMSNRPGIGALAVPAIGDALRTKDGARFIAETDDVPRVLGAGSNQLPLGRYLRKKLRENLNIPDRGYDNPSTKTFIQEMQLLYQEAGATTEMAKRALLYEKSKQRIRQIETRHKIFKQRKTI